MSTPRRKRPAKKPAVPAVAAKCGALAADIRRVSKALRVLKRAGVGKPPVAGDELPRKQSR